MLISAGDVNIDIKQETSDVKRYIEMPSNHWTWSKSSPNRGGSRIFFRRGCTRLLLYFNTNKPHFFFCRIPVVLENRRSSRGGGGGAAHLLHPAPRSAPAKAARTTKSSPTLVDHVITNLPRRVTHTDVLPCTLVSDHDAPYVFFLININPWASNLAELVKWSPDTTQKQRY